ncbi:MAG TPA: 2OG-Fe(II) oxygenase [Burkholderiaceae bacterium]|nr:2OG-Fe(II) oxygenase [Burkholderiaceae bacterium]
MTGDVAAGAANDERPALPPMPAAPVPAGADPAAGGWPGALLADWQDWLTSALVRGADDASLLAAMGSAGFDAGYARTAISVVRSMTERVRAQDPALLRDYVADPIRLPAAGTRLRVADREVRLGMVLSNPNVAIVEDLLSEQECDKLIQLIRGRIRRSEVVDPLSGRLEISGVRRSEGGHFEYGENAIVARLEARVAALTGLPVPHGEPLQLLHYPPGGEYEPHHDYFDPAHEGSAKQLAHGGQRVATLVMYLREPERGGDTWFPELELSVRPRRGSAVYFEYHNARGELDARCLHAGMPVLRGDKWIATKWLRQSPYAGS